MTTQQINTPVGEFFTTWETYRKVLENNYMHHQAIYREVRTLLQQKLQQRLFTLVDLGCGDACFLANALIDMNIFHYTGFDLSEPALRLAAENITPLGCEAHLQQSDFMQGLAQMTEAVDVIFAGYALHHLSYEDKARFFSLAKQKLTENGFVLMVDVMREPDETLPIYLDSYCQWMTETWTSLNSNEIRGFHHHVRHYDITETVIVLDDLAQKSGFVQTRIIHELPWHKTLLFEQKAG